VVYEAPDAFVLVDPLVPDTLWAELDERVKRHGRPVLVLTTLRWHRRSRDAVVERYHASTVRGRASLPADVETIPLRGAGETMVWLPRPRALIPGDRILGDGRGGVRLCPQSWLRYLPCGMTVERLRELLRPLLDLPVELVLVSHGDPVLAGGREALARALSPA
jgi:glyoxylase-like metal-dependent hydrolase (beta-lactamase superfamily II)